MEQRKIDYTSQGTRLRGLALLPTDAAPPGKRPGVLVAHDWRGRSDYQLNQSQRVAALGYVALALDMYGEGKSGRSASENAALMAPLQQDRALLMSRMNAALDALKAIPEVDASRTGAVGFCFGGMCALDLARSGADVAGVVSFHGLFEPPPAALCKPIRAKVLALHGYNDPMVPPERVVALADELREAGADWQIHAYGNTVHAFTNPVASDPRIAQFNQTTNDRAMRSMRDFFQDLFE